MWNKLIFLFVFKLYEQKSLSFFRKPLQNLVFHSVYTTFAADLDIST